MADELRPEGQDIGMCMAQSSAPRSQAPETVGETIRDGPLKAGRFFTNEEGRAFSDNLGLDKAPIATCPRPT